MALEVFIFIFICPPTKRQTYGPDLWAEKSKSSRSEMEMETATALAFGAVSNSGFGFGLLGSQQLFPLSVCVCVKSES